MILEIILSIIVFIIVWFIIFKAIITFQEKRMLKDIPKKIEKQNKKFINDGKEVDFKKELGEEGEGEESDVKQASKRVFSFWNILKRGKRRNIKKEKFLDDLTNKLKERGVEVMKTKSKK